MALQVYSRCSAGNSKGRKTNDEKKAQLLTAAPFQQLMQSINFRISRGITLKRIAFGLDANKGNPFLFCCL